MNLKTNSRFTLVTFQIALLFAPFAYAIHHLEERHFGFRDWRRLYFPDNNALPTEYVSAILMAMTLAYIILHSIWTNRASAQAALLFFMATQVHNVIYHVGGSLIFQNYSPGTVTALLLYLPVNIFILYKAFQEGWVNTGSAAALFIIGGVMFWSFEMLGPIFIVIGQALIIIWLAVWAVQNNKQAVSQTD